MNTATTRGLLLVALLLGGFILFFERGTPGTAQRADHATRLLPELAVGDVTAFTLARGTNLAFRVERAGDGWEFRSPIAYPAQPASIERLLNILAQLRWQAHVTARELVAHTNGLAAFGFDPPAAALALQLGERRLELRLGFPTVLGGQLYAQVVGREGLYTVDAALLKTLPATLNEWRETALVQLAGRPYDRLEVRPITNGFEVVRSPTNRQWQMTRPLPTRADNTRLALLLQELELCRVTGFVADDPRADLEPFGLQPPEREIVLGHGTNDMLVLQIGRSPTNAPDEIFIRRLANSNVVRVARAPIAPWLAGFREFCDRRLMVFKADTVNRIEVAGDEAFALERQTNATWRIVSPAPAAADSLLVLELLQNLSEMEFLEFEREVATDFTAYGLAPPRRQFILKGTPTNAVPAGTNLVLAQLDIGAANGFKYYARRSLENSVVTLADNGRLPRAAFALRDRHLWNFTTNQILSITVQQWGQTRKLVRTGPMRWAPAPGSDGPVNPVTLEEAAYRLGQLQAERWVSRGEAELARYGFATTDHRLQVEVNLGDGPKTFTLRLGRPSLSARSAFAAVALEGEPGPVIFECTPGLFEFIQSDLSIPRAGGGTGGAL